MTDRNGIKFGAWFFCWFFNGFYVFWVLPRCRTHFLCTQLFDSVSCVCCSHRPVDVHNVYNQVQVKMLMKEDDCENIPAFEDVFRDDEDDEQEDEEACFAGIFVKSVFRFFVILLHVCITVCLCCNYFYPSRLL